MHFVLPLPPVASAGLIMLSIVEMDAAPGPLGILSCGVLYGSGVWVVWFANDAVMLSTTRKGAMMSADGLSTRGSVCGWGVDRERSICLMAYTARRWYW